MITNEKRRRVYKSESGVEIKPSIVKYHENGHSTDQTYYYVYYFEKEDNSGWKVQTNSLLYNESTIIHECATKVEAEKIARIVNVAIWNLIENLNLEG